MRSNYNFNYSHNDDKFLVNNNNKPMIQKKLKQLFITSVLSLLVFSSHIFAAGCVNWSQNTFVPNTNLQGQKLPSYGLYWFKADGSASLEQSTMKACNYGDKACQQKELASGYFDPNKPTIIFIHGWQPSTVNVKNRFDFCYKYKTAKNTYSPTLNVLQSWKGYNVAVFYWNQFADDNLYAAEAKVYTTHGVHGMQWKYLDKAGVEHTCKSGDSSCVTPNESITDLAFDAYKKSLPKVYNKELRITGQSLGAQVAIQLTKKIMQHPLLPQPTRLVLMDPYFSEDGVFTAENNLPYSVAQYNSSAVTDILALYKHHHALKNVAFPISMYRTSVMSFAPTGNPNWNLIQQVAYMRIYPVYLKAAKGLALKTAQHISSIYLYFYSKQFVPQASQDVSTVHIDAASTHSQVMQLMQQRRYQVVNKLADPTYQKTWLSKFTNVVPSDPMKR